MRIIDADELKKRVLKWLPKDPCGREEKEMPFETDICVSVLMEIDEQPTIQSEQRWIPVTERLPEERRYDDSDYVGPSNSVLVYTKYNTYYISRYWGHRTTKGETSYVIPDWMDLDEYISDVVVAWMPLPKPREGDVE